MAFPRLDLSRLLKRYMVARTGRMRVSSFHTSFFSMCEDRTYCSVSSTVGDEMLVSSSDLESFLSSDIACGRSIDVGHYMLTSSFELVIIVTR